MGLGCAEELLDEYDGGGVPVDAAVPKYVYSPNAIKATTAIGMIGIDIPPGFGDLDEPDKLDDA